MKIKAAVFHRPGVPFDVRTVELDPPKAGEVLVRVRAVGVCHSDWHLMTGATRHPLPAVPGHEGSGVVEAVGSGVASVSEGDHVALNWAPSCGKCFYCGKGRPNLCDTYTGPIWNGTMLDGTPRLHLDGQPVYHYCGLACFAEYAVVPEPSCIRIAADLPLEVAALIGCAVTTGVGSVLNTAKVERGSSVAVFGVGGVGLSTILGARLAGAERIIAIDPLESRRSAAMTMGATHALAAGDGAPGQIKALTAGRGADYTFEAAGIPAVQELAFEAARPGGIVVFSGLSPMGSSTNLPGSVIVRQEKTIMGSYYGTADAARDFLLYARLYQEGKLPLDRLVSERYPLEQINEAYADMLAGAVTRGVVVL